MAHDVAPAAPHRHLRPEIRGSNAASRTAFPLIAGLGLVPECLHHLASLDRSHKQRTDELCRQGCARNHRRWETDQDPTVECPAHGLADCRDGSCGRWFGVGGHLCGVLQRLAHADLIGRTPAQLNDAAQVTPQDIAAAQEFWAYWGTPLLNALLDAEAEPAGE